MERIANSNQITREYLDSLLIETRYMNSCIPSTEFELFGEKFSSPIMTAALSHLDHFMFEGASMALAKGAKDADVLLWYGMAPDEEIESLASTGAKMVEIIKPYQDREKIMKKIRHAEEIGLLAVGIDIDHPFNGQGFHDVVDGEEMEPVTTEEMREFCSESKLPLIAKGVLSVYDAQECMKAGVSGMLLSHHNNRIEYACPPLLVLPDILKVTAGKIPVFVDDEISTGMDAFKALALGASAVGVGRPLMSAIKKDVENGVCEYLKTMNDGLRKAMAYTGTSDLSKMDASVIHHRW